MKLYNIVLYIIIILLFPLEIKIKNKQGLEYDIKLDSIPLHLDIALNYLGTKEKGENKGEPIETFQRFINLPPGSPYCAAFVSYILNKANVTYPNIKSSLSLKFITDNSISANDVLLGKYFPQPGDLVIFRYGYTYSGHIGITVKWLNNKEGITLEANTTPGYLMSDAISSLKDFEGDGIYLKYRKIEPANYFKIIFFTPVKYN